MQDLKISELCPEVVVQRLVIPSYSLHQDDRAHLVWNLSDAHTQKYRRSNAAHSGKLESKDLEHFLKFRHEHQTP